MKDHHSEYLAKTIAALTPEGHVRVDELLDGLARSVGDLVRDHSLMEEARREAVAALDDPSQASALAALVNTSWERRFGLVGIG